MGQWGGTHSWPPVGNPHTDRATYADHDMICAVVYICHWNDVYQNRPRFQVWNSESNDGAGRSRSPITQHR